MPDFDFDAFNHDTPYEGEDGQGQRSNNEATTSEITASAETPVAETTATPEVNEEKTETPIETNTGSVDNGSTEEVDKW